MNVTVEVEKPSEAEHSPGLIPIGFTPSAEERRQADARSLRERCVARVVRRLPHGTPLDAVIAEAKIIEAFIVNGGDPAQPCREEKTDPLSNAEMGKAIAKALVDGLRGGKASPSAPKERVQPPALQDGAPADCSSTPESLDGGRGR